LAPFFAPFFFPVSRRIADSTPFCWSSTLFVLLIEKGKKKPGKKRREWQKGRKRERKRATVNNPYVNLLKNGCGHGYSQWDFHAMSASYLTLSKKKHGGEYQLRGVANENVSSIVPTLRAFLYVLNSHPPVSKQTNRIQVQKSPRVEAQLHFSSIDVHHLP
jgi:hypothetical protein